MRRLLRHGFTTGACAAAAAKGAALMLRNQCLHASVELVLPTGLHATFVLHGQRFSATTAACCVIKDAGDDPDVTNGCEVWAEVTFLPKSKEEASRGMGFSPQIAGGAGIGRVTKPGLALPVGAWAINPVPRHMICEVVREVFPPCSSCPTPHVLISIPDGEARARRTLNARLGIIGGLSILGTTGVVTPVSHRAWTDTIDTAIQVALASGTRRIVASTGRSSESVAQSVLELPEEGFVLMGDHVGYLAKACRRHGIAELVLAAQFAKLVKIACGHPQTHAGVVALDLARVAAWARAIGLDDAFAKRIEWAHTARELYQELGPRHPLMKLVAERAIGQLHTWAPGVDCGVILAGYAGEPAVTYGELFEARKP